MQVIKDGLEYNLQVGDIMKLYGFSDHHVWYLARTGRIPSTKRGRTYLFNRDQVDDAIQNGYCKVEGVHNQPEVVENRELNTIEYTDEELDDIIFGV